MVRNIVIPDFVAQSWHLCRAFEEKCYETYIYCDISILPSPSCFLMKSVFYLAKNAVKVGMVSLPTVMTEQYRLNENVTMTKLNFQIEHAVNCYSVQSERTVLV